MATLKTTPGDANVEDFLNKIEHEQKRKDSFVLLDLFREVTQCEAKMWGSSIIGFGSYHYKYESGREGDWLLAGFSPRKQNLALYLTNNLDDYQQTLTKLGKHKTGKGCLYINKLEDVDLAVLKKLLKEAVDAIDK